MSVVHLHEDEDGGLALLDALEQVGMIDVARGQLWQLVRELEQQLQSLAHFKPEKVVSDLGKLCGESPRSHSLILLGRNGAGLGALDDRNAHGRCPTRSTNRRSCARPRSPAGG